MRGAALVAASLSCAVASRVRVYTKQPLTPRLQVSLTDQQRHYLFSVMRIRVGESVRLFNGQDGEQRRE